MWYLHTAATKRTTITAMMIVMMVHHLCVSLKKANELMHNAGKYIIYSIYHLYIAQFWGIQVCLLMYICRGLLQALLPLYEHVPNI